jgi:hypothetical protein
MKNIYKKITMMIPTTLAQNQIQFAKKKNAKKEFLKKNMQREKKIMIKSRKV